MPWGLFCVGKQEEAAASMGSGLRGAYFLKKPLNDSEAD